MMTALSERELQILRLVAEGFSNRQIAGMLDISENTVKVHVRNIFSKIHVASRTEASMYAVRHGLLADVRVDELEEHHPPVLIQQQPVVRRPLRWRWIIGVVLCMSSVSVAWWWNMRDIYQTRVIGVVTDAQQWGRIAALPSRWSGVQYVTVAGQLYALGGALDRRMMQYDASRDVWNPAADMPFAAADSPSWSDATGVWVIDESTQTIWMWNGRTWQVQHTLPDEIAPADMVRVAGAVVILDVMRQQIWVYDARTAASWSAYALPAHMEATAQLVVLDAVLYLLGDTHTVWRSLDQGRTWQIDGVLGNAWRGGQAIPVLNAIMLFRDGQQSIYTLTVGEGGSQSIPVAVAKDASATIWQTMVIIGTADGSRIDTYQFLYQSFVPMLQ
jgi:DNA-binding CsgD family transcriptional regulator